MINEHLESEFIGRIAQLQFLNRSGDYQLNLRQRVARKDSQGLFDNLHALLLFDLKSYAEGKHPFPADAQQRLARLETDLIWTRLFSKRTSDVRLAKSIIAAMIRDQLDNLSIAHGEQMPIEFRNATWLNLYRTIEPTDKATDGQFALGDVRRIFRFVQESERRNRAVARVVLGVMTFIANRFHTNMSKQLLLDFIQIAKVDEELFSNLTNTELLKRIVEQQGPAGVSCWLESAIMLHSCRDWPVGFGRLLSHLMQQIPSFADFAITLRKLTALAAYEGISQELVQLLLQATDSQKIGRILECCHSKAGPLSLDGQAICCSITKAQPAISGEILANFSRDIARIGLDLPLKSRLIKTILGDERFARHLACRQLEPKALVAKFQQATSLEDQFYWLILISLQNLKGSPLEDVSRGISMLHRLRRSAKIDEHHYQELMKDIAQGLPSSLEKLHVFSDEISDDKLQSFYMALHIAATELHSPKMTAYFSDTVYRLNKYDKGMAKHLEQHVGPIWVRQD